MTLSTSNWKPIRHTKPNVLRRYKPSANINYNEQRPHREAQTPARLSFASVPQGVQWFPCQESCRHKVMGVAVTKAQPNTSKPITEEKFNALEDRINRQNSWRLTQAPNRHVNQMQGNLTTIAFIQHIKFLTRPFLLQTYINLYTLKIIIIKRLAHYNYFQFQYQISTFLRKNSLSIF